MTAVITPEENEMFLKGDMEYIKATCPDCGDTWVILRGHTQPINRS